MPIGWTIMAILRNHIRTELSEHVTIMTNTAVTRLSYSVDDSRHEKKTVHGVFVQSEV